MIKELNIKNFAIIDSLKVKFGEAFNVISGETGAGKTLIIKALDILLGGKINKKMIRDDLKELEISAKFYYKNEILNISRVYKKDRSYSAVNNKRVSSSEILKHYSSLVQFQRQHDSNDLLDNSKHIFILDSYIGHQSDLDTLKNLFNRYLEDKKNYDDIVDNAKVYEDRMNLHKFQIDELESIELDSNEESLVNKKYKNYINSKGVIDTVNQYLELNEDFHVSPINNIEKNIKSLSKYQSDDKDINDLVVRLEEVLLELKDIREDVSGLDSKYYFNEDDKNVIEEKVLQYEEIKRKYGGSIESAIKYKDDLILEFEGNFSFEDKIGNLKSKLDLSKKIYIEKAQEISAIRKVSGLDMESKINNYLYKVDMPNSRVKILINSSEDFKDSGIDQCEIYVITNKGEKYKPLKEIASGGEISRIMLSISLVLSNINTGKTLVFDEVDTGVSGATANSMGKLLKGLSSKKQLIVVTHLPQIASKSDTHLYSYKIIEKSRTMGKLKSLDDKARKNEIARMLSGEEITKHSLKQAERFILDG